MFSTIILRMVLWIIEDHEEVKHWTDFNEEDYSRFGWLQVICATISALKINSHLFIRKNRGDYLPDQAVTKTFITKSVQSFSGFGPQTLRISCLQELAALNGPIFLREAYGISATHAGRYGSYEEYLVEEALKDIGLD